MTDLLPTMPVRDDPKLVKVRFNLEPEAWHGHVSETVWAEPVAVGRYRVRNTPFFAHGVSAEDVVSAQSNPEEPTLLFDGVSQRGGHSTYRVFSNFGLDDVRFRNAWKPLEERGCSYESTGKLLAVDVPPSADIHAVYDLLEKGESDGVWGFEEGHCGHPLREQE